MKPVVSLSSRTRRLLIAAALLLPALLLFGRSLFLGRAFVPADLLGYVAPWSFGNSAPDAAWNVLRFDGIAEFYPWRLETVRQIQSGAIPLWTTHSFAAAGGAPLLADSQSSPLYPPNILFYLLPTGLTWYGFGLIDALHLTILAAGMYRFLRAERCRRLAAVLGAAVIAMSGPVVAWLALPTFLAVACWLPWLLWLIRRAHEPLPVKSRALTLAGAGLATGLMLLAGHLQMAFYGLLAGGLYALAQASIAASRQTSAGESHEIRPGIWLAAAVAVAGTGALLALPQVLPALELSRVSHRAGAPPTMDAYQGYVANAFPLRNLVTLLVPDFFGNPNPVDLPYWNTNNYGEWAIYAGIAPLLLAIFALALPWRKAGFKGLFDDRRVFWTGLGAIALLLAMGSPLNLPLFFLVPGYSQTGNPGRCLILLAFAIAALAAHGLTKLLDGEIPAPQKRRAGLIAVSVAALAGAAGASQAARFAASAPELAQASFGQLLTADLPTLLAAGIFFAAGAILLFAIPRLAEQKRILGGAAFVAISVLDLILWGGNYNPTVPAQAVYPVTPGIAYLQQHGADALIAPLNRNWSLGLFDKRSPKGAVLPPNALTVYGLHDIGGYDSLFPGTAKAQIREANGGNDPSPPENGNMLFVKSPEAALALGARYLVLSPETAPPATFSPPAPLREVFRGSDLVIWENPTGKDFDPAAGRNYHPDSFRVGLFCGLIAVAALSAVACAAAGGYARRTPEGHPEIASAVGIGPTQPPLSQP